MKMEKLKTEHAKTIQDKDALHKQSLLDKEAEHQDQLKQKEFLANVEKEKLENEKNHHELNSKENELKHLEV